MLRISMGDIVLTAPLVVLAMVVMVVMMMLPVMLTVVLIVMLAVVLPRLLNFFLRVFRGQAGHADDECRSKEKRPHGLLRNQMDGLQ